MSERGEALTRRESEMRLRAITDSAQDAILMMDPEGRVSYWNPAAERMSPERAPRPHKQLRWGALPSYLCHATRQRCDEGN